LFKKTEQEEKMNSTGQPAITEHQKSFIGGHFGANVSETAS
jgi:hypothetical protein